MKILFVRHGESTDDLDNQYGGWADYEITENGKQQMKDRLSELKKLGETFDVVLTSPLKRAVETGKVIAEDLALPLEVFEYAKERNTYGILSGMKKEDAKVKYPDLVAKLDAGEYVYGSETKDQLKERVEASLSILKGRSENNLIVVTHGKYLDCLINNFSNKKFVKAHDCGFVLTEVNGDKLEVVDSNGIDLA
jgi:2,3-bisphosphoglycerate-dependent phosphoglycerate mutase